MTQQIPGAPSAPAAETQSAGRLIRLTAVMADGGHFSKWASWPSTCAAIDDALAMGARSAAASVVSHVPAAA